MIAKAPATQAKKRHWIKRTCPVHAADLNVVQTQYGPRMSCPVQGCTVVCWGGTTSLPADAETRAARQRAHDAFDWLWQGRRLISRRAAYAWLAIQMGIPDRKCHIGMFNAEQCREVERWVDRLIDDVVAGLKD